MERGIRIGSGRRVLQKALVELADLAEGNLTERTFEMFEGRAAEDGVLPSSNGICICLTLSMRGLELAPRRPQS